MGARFAAAVLLALLGILHAQLWLGRGSVSEVRARRQQLAAQTEANQQARLRNEQLANEIRDLLEGQDMIEEMARMELGMVRPNEVFVQIAKPAH
jgi:cell division protein FtsB